MDLISVIIPYYRKREYIRDTLNSVLRQTYKNLEVIIIYDDQEKEDLTFIKELISLNKRISLIINKKSLGAGFSRNKGIKNAKVSMLVSLMQMIYGKKINWSYRSNL